MGVKQPTHVNWSWAPPRLSKYLKQKPINRTMDQSKTWIITWPFPPKPFLLLLLSVPFLRIDGGWLSLFGWMSLLCINHSRIPEEQVYQGSLFLYDQLEIKLKLEAAVPNRLSESLSQVTNWIAKQWELQYSSTDSTQNGTKQFGTAFLSMIGTSTSHTYWAGQRFANTGTFFGQNFVQHSLSQNSHLLFFSANPTDAFQPVIWSLRRSCSHWWVGVVLRKHTPLLWVGLAYNETNQFFPYVGSHVPAHQLRCLESRLLGKRTCPKGVGCDCSLQSRKTHQGSVSTLGFSRPMYREPHLENMVSHSLSSHGWFCGVSIGGKLMEIRGFSNQLWLEKATSLFVAMA